MLDTNVELIAHLLRRAGFGANRAELAAGAAKGYAATVEELLTPQEEQRLRTIWCAASTRNSPG